jgi:hypothetical protein
LLFGLNVSLSYHCLTTLLSIISNAQIVYSFWSQIVQVQCNFCHVLRCVLFQCNLQFRVNHQVFRFVGFATPKLWVLGLWK